MIVLTKRLTAGIALVLASVVPCVAVSGVASADTGESWALNPVDGRPFDFQSYPQESGWQSNPAGPTMWGFWPVCSGTTLDDGSSYSGGRSTYCVRSLDARQISADVPWTRLTPRLQGADPRSPAWSTEWAGGTGRSGVGGRVSPSVRTVGGALLIDLWDGVNDLDPAVEYRISVHIGTFDMSVMRSVGSGGAFTQTTEPSGGRVVTVSSRPGARSVMIPPTDACKNPNARATRSHAAAWSASLFDRKIFTKFAPFDGAVLESDAYGTGDAFPVFDTRTGTFSVKVCAPHFRADGSLNVGYYRLVLTQPMLARAGYHLADSAGRPVTDGRKLSGAERSALEARVAKDFRLSSSEQPDIAGQITLVISESGAVSVSIYADVHYSSPVLTVSRTGAAVWQVSTDASTGGYVDIGYQTSSRTSGTLIVELRNKAGSLVAKSSRTVKSVTKGRADVRIPRTAKSGAYVLKVYMAGKKLKGKVQSVTIQNLPVQVTKAP